ncbi:hypothetical protein GCM10017688_45890 [Streptomyces ramulosus]
MKAKWTYVRHRVPSEGVLGALGAIWVAGVTIHRPARPAPGAANGQAAAVYPPASRRACAPAAPVRPHAVPAPEAADGALCGAPPPHYSPGTGVLG